MVLVMIGLFLTNVSHLRARYNWSAMFPIFGIREPLARTAEPRPRTGVEADLRQAPHWLGPIIAVQIIFLQTRARARGADAVALATSVTLAVTCFISQHD